MVEKVRESKFENVAQLKQYRWLDKKQKAKNYYYIELRVSNLHKRKGL